MKPWYNTWRGKSNSIDLPLLTAHQLQGYTTSNEAYNNNKRNLQKQQEHASGAATRDVCYETVARPTGTNDPRETKTHLNLPHAKHAEKRATRPKIVTPDQTGQIAQGGRKHLKQHHQTISRSLSNHKPPQCSSHKPWHQQMLNQKTSKATSSLRGLHRLQILHHI